MAKEEVNPTADVYLHLSYFFFWLSIPHNLLGICQRCTFVTA